MRIAEWILTFDDGPLPAESRRFRPGAEARLLRPLGTILNTLRTHLDLPIRAVFFLRGPGFPWRAGNRPSKPLFREGLRMMFDAHHDVGIHCYAHDPDLWWNWALRGREIHADLDRSVRYFDPMLPAPMRVFRPPYGQGGLAGMAWAVQHGVRHRRWDVDTEDWLHHPDAGDPIRRFAGPTQANAHLEHIREGLPRKLWIHTVWPGANDLLLHVSERTAASLPRMIDTIVETTCRQDHEPRFVVPDAYLQP